EALRTAPRTVELESPPDAGSNTPATLAEEPRARSPLVWIGAAALAIVLVVVGVLVSNRSERGPVPTETTASVQQPAGGDVTVVAPARLGLHAYPWGELSSVKNLDSGQAVGLAESMVTPASLELPPGRYELTMNGPDGTPLVMPVELTAGEVELVTFQFRKAVANEYPDFGGGR
ncbi:MAG: hypothetical protein ACSLFQ_14995, partial [Thermoanaerobaculia bacterium]